MERRRLIMAGAVTHSNCGPVILIMHQVCSLRKGPLHPFFTPIGMERRRRVVAQIPATSGMCSWKVLVIGERVPGQPRTKNGTPCLRYLFVLLGTKYFTLWIR
jgi:hypothetical protein